MSERETGERVVQIPLQFIKPLPFNTTVIGSKEEHMLHEEMKRPDGPERIDPIIVRRMTPEEMEECRDKYPWAKYEIVDGHTRFRMAKQLHWPWIRARILDISREKAYEMNYRRNKERGTVSQLAEATYFKHLQTALKMSPYEIGEMFGFRENEVKEILSRAVLPKDARDYIASKLPETGRLLSSKHLEIIASAPEDKQRVLAETIIEGKLRRAEAEKARNALASGLPKDEAIRIARAKPAVVNVSSAAAPPSTAAAPDEGEIACPKCGTRARVNWAVRQILWADS